MHWGKCPSGNMACCWSCAHGFRLSRKREVECFLRQSHTYLLILISRQHEGIHMWNVTSLIFQWFGWIPEVVERFHLFFRWSLCVAMKTLGGDNLKYFSVLCRSEIRTWPWILLNIAIKIGPPLGRIEAGAMRPFLNRAPGCASSIIYLLITFLPC